MNQVKKFKNQAAQGDVLVRRIGPASKKKPENALDAIKTQDRLICGHSETGHHHYVVADKKAELFSTSDPLVSLLNVRETTQLKHDRQDHQHQTLELTPGLYEIRRQREQTPEGWKRVAD